MKLKFQIIRPFDQVPSAIFKWSQMPWWSWAVIPWRAASIWCRGCNQNILWFYRLQEMKPIEYFVPRTNYFWSSRRSEKESCSLQEKLLSAFLTLKIYPRNTEEKSFFLSRTTIWSDETKKTGDFYSDSGQDFLASRSKDSNILEKWMHVGYFQSCWHVYSCSNTNISFSFFF